ncbi:MAG TPA: LL-diaminopimelate aminotransferase [bacterium]|nr:LL-diaminopimelate aminotransferase [bacterium]HQL62664.1 LL-diaminopimelate aminotransferase [bacterium]
MNIKPADRLKHFPVYLFDALDQQKVEQEAKGVDVIDLSVGDPDRPTPKYIVEALREAVLNPDTHHYPSYKGLPAFRKAVAQWYKSRYGVDLDPDTEVMSVIGSKAGMSGLPPALVNPGETVLVPDPCYPAYLPGIVTAGGEVHFMPLFESNDFLPDLNDVPEEVRRRAKLMILNFPSNPTASICTLDYFKEVVAFAQKYEIIVAHDAPYSEMMFDGNRQPSFLEAPGAKEVGIEFHSMSKTFNMSGWRCAFAVGNAAVIGALGKLKSNLDMGIFEPIQYAAIAALTGSMDFTHEMCRVYQRRRDVLLQGLARLGWKPRKNPATFFVWTPVPEQGTPSGEFAAKALQKAGVLITPGAGFGKGGEGYVRIALTVEEDRMCEVVDRFEKAGLKYV